MIDYLFYYCYNMKKKFAIVGCGRIAQRHAEQINKVGVLVAVCDINTSRGEELALKYKAKYYNSLEELLKNEINIDVVSVCTPNGLHAKHSIMILQSGTNVLCEKPLCINVEDGKKMISAAQNASKKLFVVKQNRYNPPVVFLKELISKGKLGQIFSFQINCFWNRPTAYYTDWKGTKDLDGGTLFTQFSHFVDLLNWLLGDVEKVQATLKNYAHPSIEFEDTGAVILQLKNGAIGTFNYTVNAYHNNMEGSLSIFAEKGSIKIGGQYLNELEYCNVEDVAAPTLPSGNPANGYGFYKGSMSNHDKVYENLIAALQDETHEFASAEEGLITVSIIEKIYQSVQMF